MEQEQYHITVKSVESGEVVMDRDSAAFTCIAANEENTHVLTSIHGDPILVVRLLWRAQEEIDWLLQAHPELKLVVKAIAAMEAEDADKTDEEDA